MRKMFSEKQIKGISADVATDVIESGLIENAKPIYCHAISLQQTSSSYSYLYRLTCLIFNNDEEAMDISTFKTFLQNLYTQVGDQIRIMMSGAIKSGTTILIASHLSTPDGNSFAVNGMNIDGTPSYISNNFDLLFANAVFNDGVNKIN